MLLCEQPEPGPPANWERIPVGKDQWLQRGRKGDKPVVAVLGVSNMYPAFLQVDIPALEVAELVQAQASGIKDGQGKLHLRVLEGTDEGAYKLP